MKRMGISRREAVRGRPGRKWGVLAALAVLTGCDVPTSAPILEPRFVLPGASLRLGVSELLPPSMTFGADAFAVRVSNPVTTWTLGELCGATCTSREGQLAPKPAFAVTLTTELPLPEGVLSAVVSGGAVTLRLANNLNFDPLQPAEGAQGYGLVEMRSGETVLASRAILGAMPPASIMDVTLPVQPSQVAGPLTIRLRITSPAGDSVRMDPEGYVMIAAVPVTAVELTEASILVDEQPIEMSMTSLDLTEIDETTRSHVLEGGLQLQFDNPFAATGDLELTVTPEGGTPIVKTLVPIAPGESSQRVSFTRDELDRMLGRLVSITASGEVTQTEAEGVLVHPDDVLQIRADLDLTITSDAK